MLKHTLTAAALAAALATPAFAQTATPMTKTDPMVQSDTAKPDAHSVVRNQSTTAATQPGEKFVQNQHATDWRGSKLIGATVYGSNNASIGEVNDVLISNDGQVRAAVIGVGGFLGVGEKNVAVPLDALQITRKNNSDAIEKITVSYTKDELKNAPKFAYYDASKPQTTGSGVSDKLKSLNPMPDKK